MPSPSGGARPDHNGLRARKSMCEIFICVNVCMTHANNVSAAPAGAWVGAAAYAGPISNH